MRGGDTNENKNKCVKKIGMCMCWSEQQKLSFFNAVRMAFDGVLQRQLLVTLKPAAITPKDEEANSGT